MFVSLLKTPLKITGVAGLLTLVTVAGATAADNSDWSYKAGTIPVTINLSDVEIADGPIYISVQKREEYRGMIGH